MFACIGKKNAKAAKAEKVAAEATKSVSEEVAAGTVVKPSVADMKKAHILYVTLKCNWEGNPDIKTVDDMKYGLGAGGMTAMYAPPNGPKGLRHKYFTYCKETDSIYGVYTWFDRESLDNYVNSDLFAAHLTWPQFSSVSYQIFDVMEGTELAIDQGAWSGENGAPCAADFDNKAYMLHVFLSVDYKGNPDVPNEEAFRWGVRADGGKFPAYYVGMDGLRSKFFTMLQDDNGKGRPATDLCVGFYTFFTKEALDTYLESDLFKMHGTFPQFAKIDYAVHEVLPGTERTMDLGSWTGAGK
jgi:hypothetical protein